MTAPPRALLACARAFAALLVLACMLGPAIAATADDGPLPVRELAPGIFVHAGLQEDSSARNLGDIANIGFIIGSRCVAVVDTGGTAAVGRRLRAAVRRVTPLPVCYVINTHVHPDHIFGNAAFVSDAPVYVGHDRLPAAMAARGRNYVHALERDLGEPAAGSEVLPPTLTVRETRELDLGDRILQLRAWPTAHTDNDLTVFDTRTGTLWLSDLLFVRRIPVVDGSLKGWLAAIAQMQRLEPKRVVAGHGEAGAQWREALADQARYLNTLLVEVRQAIREKKTLQQAVDTVGLSERGRWLLFDGFHRRNVTAAYAELEWED